MKGWMAPGGLVYPKVLSQSPEKQMLQFCNWNRLPHRQLYIYRSFFRASQCMVGFLLVQLKCVKKTSKYFEQREGVVVPQDLVKLYTLQVTKPDHVLSLSKGSFLHVSAIIQQLQQ